MIVINAQAKESEVSSHFSASRFIYTEPANYRAFSSDFKTSDFHGGSIVLEHVWAKLSVRYNLWEVGLIHRSHTAFEFSKDTAEIVYLVKNKKELAKNRLYHVDVQGTKLDIEGVNFGKSFVYNKTLRLALGGNIIRGTNIIYGDLRGDVVALSENDIEFQNMQIDYKYADDILFGREVDAPKGSGFTADFSIFWQPNPQISMAVNVLNAYGFINWDKAPFTTAEVNSDNKSYDENGYVTVDPTFSGQTGNENIKQMLPRLVHVLFTLRTENNFNFLLDIFHTELETFVSAGFGVKRWGHWQMLYTPNIEALTLAYQNKWVDFSVMTDSYNINRARALGLKFGLNYLY